MKKLTLLFFMALPLTGTSYAVSDETLALKAEAKKAQADGAKATQPKKTPYKIVIITDDEANARAHEFRTYLMKKPPYNKIAPEDLEIKIVKETKENMDCKHTMPDSPRIVGCNNTKLNQIKAQEEAHLAMAFTSSASGGAGGDIPVASKDYPIQTMLHETLHTYGMADEYCYSESEAKVYCEPPMVQGNSAHFPPEPPYESDAKARVKHAGDVSWMGGILTTTLITQGTSLGSKEPSPVKPGKQEMGLYKGGTCDKKKMPEGSTTPFQSWRPYANSIMRGYVDDTIYPLYENIIVKSIESKIGRPLTYVPVAVTEGINIKEDCEAPKGSPSGHKLVDIERAMEELKKENGLDESSSSALEGLKKKNGPAEKSEVDMEKLKKVLDKK